MGLLSIALHIIAFIFDLFTYIPFYFIQEPRRALEISGRQKGLNLTNHPAGPYRCAEEGEICSTPDEECATIEELFHKAVTDHSQSPCLGTRVILTGLELSEHKDDKRVALGEYSWMTYAEVAEAVISFSKGLILEGMKVNQNVLLLAETRAEWMITAQACFRENMTLVTLCITSGSDVIADVIKHTEVTLIITTSKLFGKLQAVLQSNSQVKTVIYMRNEQQQQQETPQDISANLFSFESVLENGRQYVGDAQPLSAPTPKDTAVIMYTSGSSGPLKGVMLSHSNIVAACAGLITRTHVRKSDRYLAYLPLSNIFELVAEISCLYIGVKIGYGSVSTMTNGSAGLATKCKGDLRALKPTVLVGVPSILNTMQRDLMAKIRNSNWISKTIVNFVIEYKRKWLHRGANTPLINILIMRHLKHSLGVKHIRCVLSGGAPLDANTQEFLRLVFCCPILQGYGLTETSGAGCVSDVDDLSSGHVGSPLSCTYIKLVDWEEGGYGTVDPTGPCGELWIGGPTVGQGYYKDDDSTEEDFQPRGFIRWFATGDIGKVKEDGTIVIIDRKKDVAKLQSGEYVSPGKIETVLRTCPLVHNICVVVKPVEQAVVALVIPEREQLNEQLKNTETCTQVQAGHLGIPSGIEDLVAKQLHKFGLENGLKRFELPHKIHLVFDDWTTENGLISGSMKLQRRRLSRYYSETINDLYR